MSEIVSTPDTLGGKPRLEGHRIGVHHIVELVLYGEYTVAEVAGPEMYPHLEVPQIHAALAYYYDNRAEIDRIRERRRILSHLINATDPDLGTIAAVSSLQRATIEELHEHAQRGQTPSDIDGA